MSVVGKVELDTSDAKARLLELEQITERIAVKFQGLKAEMTRDLAAEVAALLKARVERPPQNGQEG